MRKKDPGQQLDLTQDEISLLRSAKAPDEIRDFIARSHETVGTRIMAFEKIAAAARAERLALQEIRRLYIVRDEVTDVSEWRERISRLETEKSELVMEQEHLRRQLAQQTALPAIAVHSSE